MISLKFSVLLFLFFNFVLNVLAKECTIRTEKRRFFQGPRNSLINLIARKKGYDTNGWIDISLLDENFNSIDVRVHNDKIICNQGNQILEVSLEKQTLIQQTDSATYNEVLFNHTILSPNSHFINPMPVMRSSVYANAADPKYVLPENFEGYVVCEKRNSNAVLIPKSVETVEFISPPWSVRVSVELYRNPIAQYGRQFRVTIVDNLNVLMNNQSSFTWPVPFESFAEVYDFHFAVKDSKEGRFCILERELETYELNFRCPSWKRSYKLVLANSLAAAGFAGMNIVQGLSYPFLNSEKVLYYEKEDPENSENNHKILVDDLSKKPKGVNTHVHENYEKQKSAKKWAISLSNIIYISLTALSNIVYGTVKFITLQNNLRKFNREFDEAPLFYPWKLQYPEDFYTPNNVEVPADKETEVSQKESQEIHAESELATKNPNQEETAEEENMKDSNVVKQVEQFVVNSS